MSATTAVSSNDVTALFTPRRRVESMLEFEAALVQALAECGVIERSVSEAVASQCDVTKFDVDAIAVDASSAGNEAIPVIERLRALVASENVDAAAYVHWGATSQDAIDTGLVLRLRAAFERLEAEIMRLSHALAALALRYAETPMLGRTWLQAAVPTTFGFKVATWLDAIERHRVRLAVARANACVLQFGGAVGTLSALGDDGSRVAVALGQALGLDVPAISWHATRDRVTEVATTLALLTGTLGKIARDISLMSQSEVGEVSEPQAPGRGRSSAMPHKSNPVGCAHALAAATRVPQLAATMLAAMPQEHERGLGGWQAEWEALPDLCIAAFDALTGMADVVAGLHVDEGRMRANIEATRGLVFAESAKVWLVERVGRKRATPILDRAIKRARSDGVHFLEALAADDEVRRSVERDDIERIFDLGVHTAGAAETARRIANGVIQQEAPNRR